MTVRILLAGAAVAALLAACDQTPDLPPPPADAPLAVDSGLAPDTAKALPPAPPAPVAEAKYDRGPDYWTQAEADDRYYDDRPPSYAYDYGDESPAVWIDGETVRRVVERLAGGGERYYYYRPGQDRPYYVQDPYYGYGYDDGSLVTVYDVRQRRALDREATRRRADEAGRYLARSEALRRAALQSEREQRRQMDSQQWREWRQREDRRARPNRPPVAQTPTPPVVIPPAQVDTRPDRPDRPDRGGRPDRGDRPNRGDHPDRGDRAGPDRPPESPVVTPATPVDPAAVERQRRLDARTARLKREADLKARREAAAARLKPPQTPTPAPVPAKPPVAAPKPPVAKAPVRTPAQEAARVERLKREKAEVEARRAAALKAKAEAERAAAEKAAAEKAAAETPRP